MDRPGDLPADGQVSLPQRFDVTLAGQLAATAGGRAAARRIVGIGEFAVSDERSDTIVTHALGSCIAVCIWDQVAAVGGLLHFLLPDAAVNPERARTQPATFANTGLPLFFQAAYALGLDKRRCSVRLVGGAEIAGLITPSSLNVGKRNLLAARSILWRNGLLIAAEATGGSIARSVAMRLDDGKIDVTSGRDLIQEL
jgi:chemotaxis protein CheD